jgi:hypothetical protein
MVAVAGIEEDLRRSVGSVELSAPDAAVQTWRRFLEHAAKPIALDSPPHPDNDVVAFEVVQSRDAERRMVHFERRIGVETADLEYLGTIVAACYLTVDAGDAWAEVPATVSIWGHGASAPVGPDDAPALEGFRRNVEASPAFAALSAGGVRDLVISVSDLATSAAAMTPRRPYAAMSWASGQQS